MLLEPNWPPYSAFGVQCCSQNSRSLQPNYVGLWEQVHREPVSWTPLSWQPKAIHRGNAKSFSPTILVDFAFESIGSKLDPNLVPHLQWCRSWKNVKWRRNISKTEPFFLCSTCSVSRRSICWSTSFRIPPRAECIRACKSPVLSCPILKPRPTNPSWWTHVSGSGVCHGASAGLAPECIAMAKEYNGPKLTRGDTTRRLKIKEGKQDKKHPMKPKQGRQRGQQGGRSQQTTKKQKTKKKGKNKGRKDKQKEATKTKQKKLQKILEQMSKQVLLSSLLSNAV